jgi:geranylgeranyl pyrophosphate synthase
MSGGMQWMAKEQARVERALAACLPPAGAAPARLHEAMRYAVLGGGKRLRPLLCRAAARAVAGGDCEAAWRPACAVECIHAYSLIHDDLPALDNDALRRGRPTCHVVFGEAMAILAGDALQTHAFALLAGAGRHAAALARALAEAAGTPDGMVAGQVMDMEAERGRATLAEVEAIHRRKTAALIRASVVLGGLAAGASRTQGEALGRYGEAVGRAFQIADDLLDETGSSAELGKTAGKDAAQAKATYPAVAGRSAAQTAGDALIEAALDALRGWGAGAGRLRALARAALHRRR